MMRKIIFALVFVCGCGSTEWEDVGKIEDSQFIATAWNTADVTQIKTDKGVYLFRGGFRGIQKGKVLFISKNGYYMKMGE